MNGLRNLNLIHFLDFYLAATFLTSVFLRVRQYHAVLGIVGAVPGRWPRLFKLVRGQHTVFLTWSTALPALLALALLALQLLTSRVLWPALMHHQARITLATLIARSPLWPVVGLLGLAMLGLDGYLTFAVEDLDRPQLEKYFDQAEYWLRSWAAPVVRVFTFGYVDPRRIVATEVRSALVQASRMLNTTLWWVAAQVGVRAAFALALWIASAGEPGA
jgi:hypothetical protein